MPSPVLAVGWVSLIRKDTQPVLAVKNGEVAAAI
jgi:hypothetical protein